MPGLTPHHPQFFTATILAWKHLLRNDACKMMITSSLQFLVENKRIAVYGFVIMPNHMHLIWQISEGLLRQDVQRDFLKFTAQKIKASLKNTNPAYLEAFRVDAKDRNFQIWERNPLSIDIYSEKVMQQKLDYVHNNPVHSKWKLVSDPVEYKFSSSGFYEMGKRDWSFLTHYMGE
jgi:putative transposase